MLMTFLELNSKHTMAIFDKVLKQFKIYLFLRFSKEQNATKNWNNWSKKTMTKQSLFSRRR